MTLHPDVIGIDIAKAHLDIHDTLDGSTCRIANTAAATARWADTLKARTCLVVMEATGRYDTTLRHALAAAGIDHARVNPGQARHFARATGRRAKTDAIDAAMLAQMGRRLALRTEPRADPARATLTGLSRRRDQLVAMRKQERTRRAEESDPALVADLDGHLTQLDQRIAALDRAIQQAMRASDALTRQAALLRSVPGIGPVAATVLIAQMPELGHIDAKAAAALAGLAPFNNDSGTFRGKRSVRGGRTRVRQALYMAALTAARSKTALGRFHQRLRDAGKPPKLALIAVARKLITILNAILRHQKPFTQHEGQHSCRKGQRHPTWIATSEQQRRLGAAWRRRCATTDLMAQAGFRWSTLPIMQ